MIFTDYIVEYRLLIFFYLKMAQDFNYRAYQDNTDKYIENNPEGTTGGLTPQERVKKFQKYLKDGKVLEVGSGAGFDAFELKTHGFDVLASDYVDNFVQILKSKNLNAIKFDLKNDTLPSNYLDGVYLNAVFVHFDKDEILTALKKIKESLKDDGVIFFSVIIGSGTEISGRAKGIVREFHYYSPKDIEEYLKECGFKILKIKSVIDGKWIHVFAQKSNE